LAEFGGVAAEFFAEGFEPGVNQCQGAMALCRDFFGGQGLHAVESEDFADGGFAKAGFGV